MKEYLEIVRKSAIFKGLEIKTILKILKCIGYKYKKIEKGTMIYGVNDSINTIALLLKGSVHMQKTDFLGNNIIIEEIRQGELFGETYAILDGISSGVEAWAVEDIELLLLNGERLLNDCDENCADHKIIIRNIIKILAEDNYVLTRKLDYVTQKGIRNKLLAYLSDQAANHDSLKFEIPYNRQQLAEYLSVDRSALSKELCKMRDEGILEFDKNKFEIVEEEILE